MKKIFKLSSIALLLILGVSCSEDEQTIATPAGAPELLNPESGAAYVLAPENASSDLLTLVWDHADYSVQTVVNYELQVAISGSDFATPISAGTTTNRYYTWKVQDLNSVALAAGLTPFTAGDVDVRVKSTLGSNNAQIAYSNVVTLTITAYSTDLPKVFLIGNFLGASGYGSDWSPAATLPALAASEFGKTDFEGYVYMNVASPEFKVLPTNTSFDGDFGDDGTFSGTLVQTGESNILLSAPGYYLIKANTGAVTGANPSGLTYSTTPTSWAITGSATPLGWPDGGVVDQNMTYNSSTKKWEITIALTAGGNQFKFRANDAWEINYGDEGNDGVLEFNNGNNLSVPADGTYFVQLDLSNPRNYTWSATLQ